MTYPWPSFSTFTFARSEQPIFGTDSGWNLEPSISRSRPLGSTADSIVTTAIGSAVRTFECYLSPTRFTALQALINTTATFTDWERPDPDSRSAFLRTVTQLEWVSVVCSDGVTRKRIRARVELISQTAT